MTTIKIKRDDLVDAMTWQSSLSEEGWFLDTETGAILLYSDECDEEDMPEDFEDNPRYRHIDPISSYESFKIMEAFIESLGDAREAVKLNKALDHSKPFRNFKDTLLNYPDLRETWFEFERKEQARLAEEWCKDNAIHAEWV